MSRKARVGSNPTSSAGQVLVREIYLNTSGEEKDYLKEIQIPLPKIST
ncbi:MAG: hypothetical protein ACK4FL_04055 [Microgenomates group bacterium]